MSRGVVCCERGVFAQLSFIEDVVCVRGLSECKGMEKVMLWLRSTKIVDGHRKDRPGEDVPEQRPSIVPLCENRKKTRRNKGMHYGVESRTDDDARLPVAEQLKVFPKMALIVHGETNIRSSSFPSLLSIPSSCSIEAEADPVHEPCVVFKSQDITLPRGIWNVFGKGISLFCGAMWVCVWCTACPDLGTSVKRKDQQSLTV